MKDKRSSLWVLYSLAGGWCKRKRWSLGIWTVVRKGLTKIFRRHEGLDQFIKSNGFPMKSPSVPPRNIGILLVFWEFWLSWSCGPFCSVGTGWCLRQWALMVFQLANLEHKIY